MNGCTSKYCTSTPMNRPITAPAAIMTGTAMNGGTPESRSLAPRMPVKPMTAPTERSIPPLRITNVMPTARISR